MGAVLLCFIFTPSGLKDLASMVELMGSAIGVRPIHRLTRVRVRVRVEGKGRGRGRQGRGRGDRGRGERVAYTSYRD